MNKEQRQQLENDLWAAADNLRANSDLKSSEYSTPVLGLIFLKFADINYRRHEPEIKADFEKLKGGRREMPLHEISKKETIFIGANNSGKTSAMDALILFLKKASRKEIATTDFTLSNWLALNQLGAQWAAVTAEDTPDLTLGDGSFSTQMIVSTHSAHVAHELDFTCLRYIRREPATKKGEIPTATVEEEELEDGGE